MHLNTTQLKSSEGANTKSAWFWVFAFAVAVAIVAGAGVKLAWAADDESRIDELEKRLEALEKEKQEKGTSMSDVWDRVHPGVQVRGRAEIRGPKSYVIPGTFGRAADDYASASDDVFLLRTRAHLKFDVEDDITAFVQIQDSREAGSEASVVANSGNVDMHQAWFEVKNIGDKPFSIKVGRQELKYGDGRLVHPLPWSNVGRAWDGIKFVYAPEDWQVDLFATTIKSGATTKDSVGFFGLYITTDQVENYTFDVYSFIRASGSQGIGEDGVTGGLGEVTLGARVDGKQEALDYSFEGTYQGGESANDTIQAGAAAATMGYTFDAESKPRVGLEYTFATGDSDPTDGKRETFNPLFPFGHFYQGNMDLFAYKNGSDMAVLLTAKPKKWKLKVAGHYFILDETTDAWYAGNGKPIRVDSTGMADDNVGAEVDIIARYIHSKHFNVEGGYGHFFAGDFVKDTGGEFDKDQDWAYLQAIVTFP